MRIVRPTDDAEALTFAKTAAEHFASNPRHFTYGEVTPGKSFAVRWNSHTVLVLKIDENSEVLLFDTWNALGMKELPTLQGEPPTMADLQEKKNCPNCDELLQKVTHGPSGAVTYGCHGCGKEFYADGTERKEHMCVAREDWDDLTKAAGAKGIQAVIRNVQLLRANADRAYKTLQDAGWTYKPGAEAWKPPLGKAPDLDMIDVLRRQVEQLKAANAEQRIELDMASQSALRKDAEIATLRKDNLALEVDRDVKVRELESAKLAAETCAKDLDSKLTRIATFIGFARDVLE